MKKGYINFLRTALPFWVQNTGMIILGVGITSIIFEVGMVILGVRMIILRVRMIILAVGMVISRVGTIISGAETGLTPQNQRAVTKT